MANQARGEVAFGAHTLRFTTNAMCEFEDASGRSFTGALAEIDALAKSPQGVSLKLIRTLVWAGLRHANPTLTEAAAGAAIDAVGGVKAALDLTGQAIRAAFPEPEADGAAPSGNRSRQDG